MISKRLDIFLVENGYYESRARAASAIKAGKVTIDGRIVTKASFKVVSGAEIAAQDEHPWVSRGGVKLAHALEIFKVDVLGKTCLDVGASAGGFTDVLLASGATKIYAVDVGQGQLHPKLKGHPKVISLEKTDARNLTNDMFSSIPQLIVCDASFISAAKVLETPLQIVAPNTELITLVKPQFEVGKDNIGRGGLVKDPQAALNALEDFSTWVRAAGWEILGKEKSPIKGGDGNTEFLLYARKK